MHVLILSGANVVAGSNNTQYRYNFPQSINLDKYASIALLKLDIYYCWFNISSSLYNNHQFSYKWFDSSGNLTVTRTVTLADGNYTVSDLNKAFQSVMFANNHYLKDADGNIVYYLSFDTNATLYAIQMYCNPLPTALPTGYTKPVADTTWKLPTVFATTPQIIIPSTGNFSKLFGIPAGTYPSATQASKYSITSVTTPMMSPASSLLMCCSLCNQPYSVPSNVLYSFNAGASSFGDIITVAPNSLSFLPCKQGSYNQMTIEFKDQDYNNVKLQDNQMVMMLVLRTRSDIELETIKE